jgi:hypothetical protein
MNGSPFFTFIKNKGFFQVSPPLPTQIVTTSSSELITSQSRGKFRCALLTRNFSTDWTINRWFHNKRATTCPTAYLKDNQRKPRFVSSWANPCWSMALSPIKQGFTGLSLSKVPKRWVELYTVLRIDWSTNFTSCQWKFKSESKSSEQS